MYRRVVMWRLAATDPQQKREDAETIAIELTSMREQIPGLIGLEVAINVAAHDDASDVMMQIDFHTKDALLAYETHPAHEAVKAVVGPLRSERRLLEYEIV